jgi:hypothetical protein
MSTGVILLGCCSALQGVGPHQLCPVLQNEIGHSACNIARLSGRSAMDRPASDHDKESNREQAQLQYEC